MVELSFFLMAAFSLVHEMDATRHREWRVLPLTSFLPDKTGEQVFVWAHVPLLAFLFYAGAFDPYSVAGSVLSGFAIVHVFLHWIFRNHPENEMNNPESWSLVIGAGLFGSLHLLLLYLA